MSDIFISYAREDHPRAQQLAAALEQQSWSVWWDWEILPGKRFDQVIQEQLDAARCVVVLWSQHAAKSRWVHIEAAEGERREILIPALIEDIEPKELPIQFRQMQAARLIDWPESSSQTEFTQFIEAITVLLGTSLGGAEEGQMERKSEQKGAGHPSLSATSWPSEFRNNIGMEFVLIPAGQFEMGSTDGNLDERPVHTVRISQPFYLGKYPVTQTQWGAAMGSNPSTYEGADRPVEQVTWEDVQEFIRKLNEKESREYYRLPTEAEWEYAARAGSTSAYSFGDNAEQLGQYAWYGDNSSDETHPVGELKPNAWGLYDMHGNVWEWVQDWYAGKYYQRSPRADPQGPSSGSHRVFRGGSWSPEAERCRSTSRSHDAPGARNVDRGFRLVRTAP